MVGDKFAALSGTAFSIIFVIALIGNMIINYGMGIVSFKYGIQQMPILLLICTVLMEDFCGDLNSILNDGRTSIKYDQVQILEPACLAFNLDYHKAKLIRYLVI